MPPGYEGADSIPNNTTHQNKDQMNDCSRPCNVAFVMSKTATYKKCKDLLYAYLIFFGCLEKS